MTQVFCATCGAECISKEGTTGYGEDAEGEPHCFKCCGELDRAYMVKTGRFYGYYAERAHDVWVVVNWPGSLSFDVKRQRKSRHNLGRERVDVWFNGPDGHEWHGVHIGDNNTIVRCRRTKRLTERGVLKP